MELEFTGARGWRLIRHGMPAEILVSAICQTLATHFYMCNQTITGYPKVVIQPQEIFGTTLYYANIVTMMH